MTSVAYAVVGHHSRLADAERLSKALDAPLALDDGSLGSLVNHDNAWRLAASQGCEWCCVVEDDVELIDDFTKHVADAVDNVPGTGAISFYTGTTRPKSRPVGAAHRNAERRKAAWLRDDRSLWGPALALPTEHVEPMLEFVSRITDIYDRRLGRYLQAVSLPCWYTRPSLVDHLDGPSLLSRDVEPRRARSVGIPDWNQRFSTI